MNSRNCPTCNKLLTYKSKQKFNIALTKNSSCNLCQLNRIRGLGGARSEESKRKISIANKGRIHSKEARENMSKAQLNRSKIPPEVGRKISAALKGRPKSAAHKEKLRLAKIKDLRNKYGNKLGPNYNKTACVIFEEINNKLNWKGLHAENGGEYSIGGYFLDYYEPTINLVIEYDEPDHKYKRAKDIEKQCNVINKLNCKFLRITKDTNINDLLSILKENSLCQE